MNPIPLSVEVRGVDESAASVQAIRSALANRRSLHAQMAQEATSFTRDFLLQTPRHRTAERLGATPTGFRAKNARAIQADSDDEAAIVRMPRSTGLGRAFADITIVPRNGRTYLTIANDAETYGKGVRDFPEDTFEFAIFMGARGPCPVLLWVEDGGAHRKGEVAYWLRRKVIQKQDRSLLPSDAGYQEVGRRVIVAYIANLIYYAP